MEELYPNVREEVKEVAQVAWNLALMQRNPSKIAKFLHSVTEYYSRLYTEEEIEFLRFYFNMKMEMEKDE